MRTNWKTLLAASLLTAPLALAQQQTAPMDGMNMSPQQQDKPQPKPMPSINMPGMDMSMKGSDMGRMTMSTPTTFIDEIEQHATSGTSAEPNSSPTPMGMRQHGDWMLMLHGEAFILDEQQSGPRGADKFFSTNWIMPMAQRRLGPGQLTLRTMFSLEPATISGRYYPLLFQQGETAFSVPIVDGQHPHNFFMEIAALYDLHLGEKTLLTLYGGPTGDPALGPTAYPHRQSASENPVGALGHHQEDSTHIAADVVSAGLTQQISGVGVRVEASGFHGREPDENRWTINQGAIDSWSTRLTLQPGKNWSGQYSYGRLTSPEQLFPTENQARSTASIMYNRPLTYGNWSSTALWGRTRSIPNNGGNGGKENSYLLESTLQFATRNYVWTRIENAGRSNELLYPKQALPAGFDESPLTHVQAYTFGYDRDLSWLEHAFPHTAAALGAQVTTYGVGQPLQAQYGDHPVGVSIFLRLRAFGAAKN